MAELDHEDRSKTQAAAETAGAAARDAAGTVKDQAGQVAGEAKAQARNLARDVRDRVGTEARSQNDRLADGVRRFADELDEMAGRRGESPASKVVSQVSQGGRRVADYLAENGPEGVLEGVQDFARRRPGTFLLAAAAAGFVVGRLGKGIFQAEEPGQQLGQDSAADLSRAYNGGSYNGRTYNGGRTAQEDLYAAQTQPVTAVPVQAVPATPPTVGSSTFYTGSPAASTEGLAAEQIPSSTTARP